MIRYSLPHKSVGGVHQVVLHECIQIEATVMPSVNATYTYLVGVHQVALHENACTGLQIEATEINSDTICRCYIRLHPLICPLISKCHYIVIIYISKGREISDVYITVNLICAC